MTDWNFDISQAPKGRTRKVTRIIGKKTVETEEHVPDYIIAAGNNGVVTPSRWLPEVERWNMFTKDTPPLAWMPWPTHPHANLEAALEPPTHAAQLAAALALPEVAALREAITALIERYDEVVTTPDCSCSQEDDAVMNARRARKALEARHD